MNRIVGLSFVIALAGMAAAVSSAKAERVMHGAMDICQSVDNGDWEIKDGHEFCCANERTEYDDGTVVEGQRYCVSCAPGTDICWRTNVERSKEETFRTLKKALAGQTKKPAAAGN